MSKLVDVLAAAEHQVLEQVGEAGAPARLVLRADAVIDRHADDRRLAVGVDDGRQPVGQGEGLVGDVDLRRRAATAARAWARGGGLLRGGGGGEQGERKGGGGEKAAHGGPRAMANRRAA